jgi:hypothetical protein
MECPDCGEPITDADSTCSSCGKSLVDLNLENQDSNEYNCRSCGEELEFISTYKQWYCYNCQEYVDLPEPTSNDIKSDQKERTEELKDDQNSLELAFDDEEDSESDLEPTADISWDQGEETAEENFEGDVGEGISDDTPENDAHNVEEPNGFGMADSEDDPVEDIGETELSWDDGDESTDDEEVEEEYDNPELSEETTHEEVEMKVPSEEEEIEIDFGSDDSYSDEEIEISTETIEIDDSLGDDTSVLSQLHRAWLKVNNILGLAPDDERVIKLEIKLKNALEGELEQNDAIILASSSLEEVAKLEKELKDMIHYNVSELFHFVKSKLNLAKKIGFTVDDLDEELDNVSSLIARSEYHQAHGYLEGLLARVLELPKTQDEIMIGLDEDSEIILELLEPRAKKSA